ncbi:MAG: SprT-like domain-containing protein [Gammaproteobacteria bacterium]|nr:SprT-like domain-containing protein [Gammaproteobacteria bacterium]
MNNQFINKTLLSENQIQEITQHAFHFIRLGEELLEKRVPLLDIHFDLSGQMAGMYCARPNLRWIRFNPFLFNKYWQENLEQTVPHEVSHYLVDLAFGARKVKPHGKEWRTVMIYLGAEPETTHGFDVSDIPVRRQRRFLYRCGCQDHKISSTRHYRLLRNPDAKYICKQCKGEITAVTSPA